MKKTIKYIAGLAIAATVFTACSQKQEQSLEAMLKDPNQQETVLTLMAEDHDLSAKYMDRMMKNGHATGMIVDKMVTAAAEDTVLAGKISNMITKYPDLMLLTSHHFMPIINADEHMCDGFCDHAMEHPNIAEGMCDKMQANEDMNCCKH